MIKKLIQSEFFRYLFFGALTTLVNIGVFLLCSFFSFDYKLATTIAWVVSVLFAYITNKRFVFASNQSDKAKVLKELLSFFQYRLLSYFIDLLTMVILIDLLFISEMISKLIANVLVVLFNYAASKYIIFAKR
jgi:putative flippase GtrA